MICLDFEWYIQGDDNRNATVKVSYRKSGTLVWKEYLLLLRIGNENCGVPEWNYKSKNVFAGIIMDLQLDTEYDCDLLLTDPDGFEGDSHKLVTIRTSKIPEEYPPGYFRHVNPENWHGEKVKPSYNGLLYAYYKVMSGIQSQNFSPSHFININSVIKRKNTACFAHESQKIRETYTRYVVII